MTSISNLWVYLALAASTVLNIIVPIAGSTIVTPLLALLTEPHLALGLTAFYFFLSGVIRIYLFRKDIDWKEIRLLLLPSAVAAVAGAYTIKFLPARILLIVVLLFTLYFFLKKLKLFGDKKTSSLTSYITGLFSGFLQGAGLAGSDLRNSYLYAQGLSIAQVQGTTAMMGAANFLIATLVRLHTAQISIPDLTPLLYIFPIMIVATLVGRHILYKIPERISGRIVVLTMAVIIIFLGIKVISG